MTPVQLRRAVGTSSKIVMTHQPPKCTFIEGLVVSMRRYFRHLEGYFGVLD